MPPSDLSHPLAGVSPSDVAVAELKALVGEGLTKSGFFELVRVVGPPPPDGKAWSTQKINECVQRLARRGVLTPEGLIAPPWETPLILAVAIRPDAVALAKAVRDTSPMSWRERSNGFYGSYARWPYYDNDLARAARMAALAGDEDDVERLIALAEHESIHEGCPMELAAVLIGDLPVDSAFVDRLSPALRDRVLSAKVEVLVVRGQAAGDLPAVIAAACTQTTDWAVAPRLDLALMRLDILGEQPDSARVRIARLKSVAPVVALAGEATLAFLEGAPDGGLPKFREALKQRRKALGKRKITLPGEFAVFHMLALFAAGDIALHGEIAAIIEAFERPRPTLAAAAACLLELVSGRDHEAKLKAEQVTVAGQRYREIVDPVSQAVTTLALAVVDGANASQRVQHDLATVEDWNGEASLPRRVLAEIHTRFPGPNPAGSKFWTAALQGLGPGYPRRFLDIVPVKLAWERTFEKLTALVAPLVLETKAPAKVATRRLVFRLDPTTNEITAVEQAAKGAGWTVGRPVALKRLQQRDPKIDYLTAEDQRACATIRLYRNYYGDTYAFDPVRGPVALVGHPLLFDAQTPDQRIDLIRYPVELVAREDRKRIVLALSHPAESPEVFIEPEARDRWRMIELTPALVELAKVLGPDGLEVPCEARDRVVALIKTDNPRLPVRSELAGAATETQKGDSRPILQIAPRDGVFHIRAVVRPVGEDGPAYAPGHGSSSVLLTEGGVHRRISRDLQGEIIALEAVAEACPSLSSWRDTDQDWSIEGLDTVLEALQELREAPGPVGLEWPQGTAFRPTRTVGANAMSLNIASGKDWFEVTGHVEIDEGLVIDLSEVLARLASSTGRFVALDDGRYLALTEDLRRRLDAFAAVTETTKGGQRIGAVGAVALEELVESAGEVTADKRWSAMIERLGAARGYEPALPAGFEAELRDYQMQGFVWMARLSRLGLGACLADDMGLGKTVQTLALLLTDAPKGPSLVVAPTSVCHNWIWEAARFAPDLRVRNLSSFSDRAALVNGLGPGDVMVVSYGLLHTEADLLASRPFAVAVFDEAQNLKNAGTRRAQASKRIDASFRLALSGTPLENRLEDLWGLFDTVTPGLLGSRERFQKRFTGPIEKGNGGHARQALRALLKPYLLRRTKAAVLTELPPRTEITLEVEPGPEERAFYEALRRTALDSLAASEGGPTPGARKRIRILAEITRLRRAACNPALISPDIGVDSAKLAALLELADELHAGRHRALVFSQFTSHLDLVEAALRERGAKLLRLDGSTPAKTRAKLVEAFQAGEGDLFLISLKAGGSGLNLTGADYVIHLDPWWNPAVEDQATDRAHRMGQTRPVTVYRLVLKDSIEQGILALHAAKRTLAADFLEDADVTGPLGEDELMALIKG